MSLWGIRTSAGATSWSGLADTGIAIESSIAIVINDNSPGVAAVAVVDTACHVFAVSTGCMIEHRASPGEIRAGNDGGRYFAEAAMRTVQAMSGKVARDACGEWPARMLACWLLMLSVTAAGCATVSTAGAGGANSDVLVAASVGPLLPLDVRVVADESVTLERRTFEIPQGFRRVAAEWALRERRDSKMFEYVARPITCEKAWEVARIVGTESGIDPGVLFGIMRVESAFCVNVISRAGAVGLTQVMPRSANWLGCQDLLDPLENARCGAKILGRFLKYFNNDMILGLSAYNAGYGMPRRALKKSGVPANFKYSENVLRARAKFLRWGCGAWE